MRPHSPIEAALLDGAVVVAEHRGLALGVGVDDSALALLDDGWAINKRGTGEAASYIVRVGRIEHGLGVLFVPQLVINGYVVDFLGVLVVDEKPSTGVVAIECDGHEWHERTQQQASYDRARDRQLLRLSIPTIRFTGSDINRDAVECAAEIFDTLEAIGRWRKRVR